MCVRVCVSCISLLTDVMRWCPPRNWKKQGMSFSGIILILQFLWFIIFFVCVFVFHCVPIIKMSVTKHSFFFFFCLCMHRVRLLRQHVCLRVNICPPPCCSCCLKLMSGRYLWGQSSSSMWTSKSVKVSMTFLNLYCMQDMYRVMMYRDWSHYPWGQIRVDWEREIMHIWLMIELCSLAHLF